MSKIVDEIIRDIRENPESWLPVKQEKYVSGEKWCGIEKEKAEVRITTNYSMHLFDLIIGGAEFPYSIFDQGKVDRAVKWWYKNCPVGVAGIDLENTDNPKLVKL